MSAEWPMISLADLYDIKSGLSKPAKDFGSGFPFLSFKDVFYNFFVPDKLTELVQANERERESCSIQRGDVFLTRTSETINELGMSCVALKDYEQATFNGFTKRLRPKRGTDLLPEYVGYYLRSPSFRREMMAFSTLMSTRASLNNDMIRRLKLLVPPRDVQESIAHILKSLDDKIELNCIINQIMEEMAQAVFKYWFVDFEPVKAKIEAKASGLDPERAAMCAISGKTDAELNQLPPDQLAQLRTIAALFPDELTDSELGLIPKGWKVGAMKDCCLRVESGGTPKRNVSKYWNGNIRWLSSGEVRDVILLETKEKITNEGLNQSSAKLWPYGTTVVAMYGATAGQVCFLVSEIAANQACCALIPKKNFQSYIFLYARRSIDSLSEKASGSAQQNLNKSLVSNHMAIIPKDNSIEIFEQTVSPMMKRWEWNIRQNTILTPTPRHPSPQTSLR